MGVVMSELKDSISIFSKIREIIIPGFSSWVSEKQTVSNKTGKINESIDSAIEYNFYFPANEVPHKNINLQIIDYYENILITFDLERIRKNCYTGKASRYNDLDILLTFLSIRENLLVINIEIVNKDIEIKEVLRTKSNLENQKEMNLILMNILNLMK